MTKYPEVLFFVLKWAHEKIKRKWELKEVYTVLSSTIGLVKKQWEYLIDQWDGLHESPRIPRAFRGSKPK